MKGAASETTCDSSRQLLSSHKSGFNKLARRIWYTPHATYILLAWVGPNDFYLFPTVKRKLERIQVADEDQFLSPCKRFWGIGIKKN
jgi:hypothetical protein